jgi:hypothetical protein
MSERMTAVLWSPQQGHQVVSQAWAHAKVLLGSGKRLVLEIKPEKRTSDQNRLLWAALGDVSEQVDWHGQKLEPAEWKDVFTAALKRQKVVPGLEGGFVVLGSSTSRMTKSEFSELMELIFAFAAERDVTFKEQGNGI